MTDEQLDIVAEIKRDIARHRRAATRHRVDPAEVILWIVSVGSFLALLRLLVWMVQ